MNTFDVMLVDGTTVSVTTAEPPSAAFLWNIERGMACDIVTSARPTHDRHCPARRGGGRCLCEESA